MRKGLEALDRLINEVEKDSRTSSFLFHNIDTWNEDKELVEKELKALEIIKKYIRVDKPFGSACYIYLNDESEMIPEEQFDLLKEVLL